MILNRGALNIVEIKKLMHCFVAKYPMSIKGLGRIFCLVITAIFAKNDDMQYMQYSKGFAGEVMT